jgi:hypothetical protein
MDTPMTATREIQHLTAAIDNCLPKGARLGVLGGTRLVHPLGSALGREIGRRLAGIEGLVILTGGVAGAGQTVARAYCRARRVEHRDIKVVHLLPEGERSWDQERTLRAGSDMAARRRVLARLAPVYLALEGGAGTAHECRVASRNGALIVPVGATCGAAAAWYDAIACPEAIRCGHWLSIADDRLPPGRIADAAVAIIAGYLSAVTSIRGFDPFGCRRDRDIRNRLCDALMAAIDQDRPEPLEQVRTAFHGRLPTTAAAAYVDGRHARYRTAFEEMGQLDAAAVLSRFAVLWNLGLFFECHALLEVVWQAAEGGQREAYKGLIQAAGAMLLWRYTRRQAAFRLAAKASRRIQRHAGRLTAINNLGQLTAGLNCRIELRPMTLETGTSTAKSM